MTGAQFDSAAQAQLQQHDKFRMPDNPNRDIASPTAAAPTATHTHTHAHAKASPRNVTNGTGTAGEQSNATVSMQLLDRYGASTGDDAKAVPHTHAHAHTQARPTSSPRARQPTATQAAQTKPGEEEPKTHDRRII